MPSALGYFTQLNSPPHQLWGGISQANATHRITGSNNKENVHLSLLSLIAFHEERNNARSPPRTMYANCAVS